MANRETKREASCAYCKARSVDKMGAVCSPECGELFRQKIEGGPVLAEVSKITSVEPCYLCDMRAHTVVGLPGAGPRFAVCARHATGGMSTTSRIRCAIARRRRDG